MDAPDTTRGDSFSALAQHIQEVPPPLTGGTLLVTRDDATVIAADADRNTVWLVANSANPRLRASVNLSMDAEPGRLIETTDNTIYVALRRSGRLAKIDVTRAELLAEIEVCPAPRGLVYREADETIHVACASGELVVIDAKSDKVLRSWSIEPDLRDVVLWNDHVLVSRFRSAEILEVSATGAIMSRVKPRSAVTTSTDLLGNNPQTHRSSPTNAWRMLSLPTGSAVVLHQRAMDDVLPTTQNGYANGLCNGTGIVTAALMVLSNRGALVDEPGSTVSGHPLTIDIALSPNGGELALIDFSNFRPQTPMPVPLPPYREIRLAPLAGGTTCSVALPSNAQREWGDAPIAGAYDKKKQLWLQTLSAKLVIATGMTPKSIPLSGAMPVDGTGRAIFHSTTSAGIACVSCHPEGRDDTHIWNFKDIGARRTQSLHRDILKTAPFHWDGELADLPSFTAEIFSKRMGGVMLDQKQIDALGAWLDRQPRFPRAAPADPAAVERGRVLFSDSTIGCASCHSGPLYTNNQTVDVGTGKAFQVPSLIDVVGRAPYMHDGCAKTLEDRFSPACGGGDRHGKTSQLSASQLGDLAAYLRTL